MEIVVAQAIVGQAIDVRRVNQATKTSHLGKSHVIQQKDNDIRRVLCRNHGRCPPFFGLFIGSRDLAAKFVAVLCYRRGCFARRPGARVAFGCLAGCENKQSTDE